MPSSLEISGRERLALMEESLFLATRDEQDAVEDDFKREGILDDEPAALDVLATTKPDIIPTQLITIVCDALWLADRRGDSVMWAMMRRDIDLDDNAELRPVFVAMIGGEDALASLDNVHDYPAILQRADTVPGGD